MKRFAITFTLCSLIILLGCQKDEQPGSRPGALQTLTPKGPSDGGGGDTCNGKLIESFKVDINALLEFKELIMPILLKLLGNEKMESSSSRFMLTPNMKNWYIIDCKLQDIPKERKGLYLETYQTAIHTSREIFIDATSYNAMVKEERAKLLLHEMVMSYYLMKYLTLSEICERADTCKDDMTPMNKWKMFRPLPYRALNEDDHQKIRNVTAWLWSNKDRMTSAEFNQFLRKNDFDNRFESADSSAGIKKYEIEPLALVRTLKRQEWTQSFPRYCHFDSETKLSLSDCKTSVEVEIQELPGRPGKKQISAKARIERLSDKRVLSAEFLFPLPSATQKIDFYGFKLGNVIRAASFMMLGSWPTSENYLLQEGARSQTLSLMLNMANPEAPEVFQMKFQEVVWFSFEDVMEVHDGLKYRVTYGYNSVLPFDSEELFAENELPFSFSIGMPSKTFLRMVPAP